MRDVNKFKMLFKKYRLKAEISTFLEFGNLLSEKGLMYDDSIFSHWQKGTRVPQRNVLLKIVEIFIERKAIVSIDQANDFLAAAGEGYLSDGELQKIPIKLQASIFQVPTEIVNFSGREEVVKKIINNKDDIVGKVVLIHGVAGVGKTALAIKLGHLLRDRFTDGVLWYKVEKDNIMDIFLSIAHIFGEDINNISDKQVRATVVRSLLTSKNVLLFLDSAELSDDIYLLIPNSRVCTTIITSQKNYLKAPIDYIDIPLKPFTDKEALAFLKNVLKKKCSKINLDIILQVTKRVGNLPLAVHIIAQQLQHSKISISQLSALIQEEKYFFHDMYYGDKNLVSTIAMSYEKLDSKMKSIIISASIFKGKDFSAKSLGYINGLSVTATTAILQSLTDLSLIEYSTKTRFRIHPAIRDFVRDKLDYPRSSKLIWVSVLIFFFFAIWWVFLQIFIDKNNVMYPAFATTYCVMALYGVVFGVHTSLKWGGLNTLLGKAILMFSLGLFMQVFGQVVYAYYTNFTTIPPYPSIGDFGFFGTIPFYTFGVYLIAKSSGIKISLQSFQKKIIALVIPSLMLIFYYFTLLQGYRFDFANPMKIFFDFAQPLGNATYVSIAIVAFIFSRTVLDGIMQSKAFLLLIALIVQFIADNIFLYRSGTYYSGNYMDFIYLVSYFVMVLALLHLKSIQVEIKNI